MFGFSYAYKGKYAAGNQISRRYSWNNIQTEWELEYNPIRDYKTLKQVAEVALKYKGEELPNLDIYQNNQYTEIPAISPHAQLYSEMKAMLIKPNSEQIYPDIPTPVEDDLVEKLSAPEVEELKSNPGKDSQLPITKKKNNQIEFYTANSIQYQIRRLRSSVLFLTNNLTIKFILINSSRSVQIFPKLGTPAQSRTNWITCNFFFFQIIQKMLLPQMLNQIFPKFLKRHYPLITIV